jgi:hypothetical protein
MDRQVCNQHQCGVRYAEKLVFTVDDTMNNKIALAIRMDVCTKDRGTLALE